MVADAGIFEKQKMKKANGCGVQNIKFNRGLNLFPFCKSNISFHPVSAVGFMNAPVSVVREDVIRSLV